MMSTDMDNLPDVEPTAMSFRLVRDITDGFSKEQLIGRGEFGDVYKGVCGDGRAIAVRKLYPLQEIDDEQLQKEFANLTKVHHQNIVRLLGYCYEQEQLLVPYNGKHVFALKTDRAMCFEYLQNGSLDRYISDTSSGLDWHTRYRIIKGICEGLRYLHEGLKSPILHMNLKPSKILLDQHMKPKIGGFGLQRLLGEGNVRRKGTIAYMPPEFIERQVISHKFDIYSIGVIIIELMTGGRSGCNDVYSDECIELAHEEWRERLQKTVNGTSVEGYYQQVKKCLEIALKCMEYDRHERPSIGDIVHRLNEIETLIPEEVRVVQNRFDSRNSELLDVHPLELCFPFMLKGRKNDMTSCALQLKNRGGDGVAFMLVANSPKRYLTKKPLYGIVPPRCAYTLTLTMLRQPPSTLSDSSVDFFTLYSVAVGQYDLLNVDKDFIQYGNFFKRSTEYDDEVQVATLKVICDRPAAKSAGTSPEIITTTPDAQQVSSIDVHPTEPWIVTTSRVGSLRLWNYLTMATFKSLQLMAHEPVHTAKFISREKWLVAADRSGGIHVYSYDQNQHVKSFDAHNNSCITTLAVHPTDPFVLSSSDDDDDHLIKLWDWNKDWKCTRTFQGHTERVTQVTFNPEDKDSFASVSWDGTVKIWSICSDDPNNIMMLKLEEHVPENLLCVDYFTLLDRQHLIVGCKDRTAQIWKLGMEGCVDRLEGHTDRISAVNLHPEVPILMTGSLDGTVRVWDSTTYKLENVIAFNLGAVYAFGCIKDSRRIVVGCHRGIAMVEISFP